MACSINESWRIGIAQREGKAKFLKAWKCGSTLLAQRLVTKVPSYLRFIAGTRKRLGHFGLTCLLDGGHTYSPLLNSLSLFPLPSCLVKITLNSLLSFRGRKYSKTIPACLAYKFSRLQTQLTRSPLLAKWSYWLSLKRRPSWKFKYK